jgi:hypothetical protein
MAWTSTRAFDLEIAMADYVGREFNGATELMDGNTYSQCVFKNCTLIFRGGQIPTISFCEFDKCVWGWEESAGRTLEFLRVVRHSMGSGGRQLVEDVARHIRTPFPSNKG